MTVIDIYKKKWYSSQKLSEDYGYELFLKKMLSGKR